MTAAPCVLHDVATRSAEAQDPTELLEFRGPERCPPTENCGGICETGRRYRSRFAAFRRNEPVPPGESPAELWVRLVELVRVERLNTPVPLEDVVVGRTPGGTAQ